MKNRFPFFSGLLLAAGLLLTAPAGAQIVGIKNILNSDPGISYNANAVTISSSTYTAAAKDHTLNVDATVAAVTIGLPAVTQRSYPFLVIKKIDSSTNTVTIDPNGSETIDGAASLVLRNRYQTIILHSDGTTWRWLNRPTQGGTVTIATGSTGTWTPDLMSTQATITPNQNEIISISGTNAVKGQFYTLKITTSGSSSYTLTFGTGFKSTGTLATGSSSGKIFVVTFYFDGSTFLEVSRTAAM